jgi:hypothetical protein
VVKVSLSLPLLFSLEGGRESLRVTKARKAKGKAWERRVRLPWVIKGEIAGSAHSM